MPEVLWGETFNGQTVPSKANFGITPLIFAMSYENDHGVANVWQTSYLFGCPLHSDLPASPTSLPNNIPYVISPACELLAVS